MERLFILPLLEAQEYIKTSLVIIVFIVFQRYTVDLHQYVWR